MFLQQELFEAPQGAVAKARTLHGRREIWVSLPKIFDEFGGDSIKFVFLVLLCFMFIHFSSLVFRSSFLLGLKSV